MSLFVMDTPDITERIQLPKLNKPFGQLTKLAIYYLSKLSCLTRVRISPAMLTPSRVTLVGS